ncbi:MAG: 2-oxo acid dehydrogenase subunit E2 [Chloroflexaceae bacterium]
MLCVTISFDHDVVDGAPAARFIHRFKELVEGCCGISQQRAAPG